MAAFLRTRERSTARGRSPACHHARVRRGLVIAAALAAALAVAAVSPALGARRPAKPRLARPAGVSGFVVTWKRHSRTRVQVRVRARRHHWGHPREGGPTRLGIPHLRPGVVYYVEVRFCGRRCSRWSRPLRVRTPTTAPAPAPLPPPPSGPAVGTGGCSVFPGDNAWNEDVTGFPVDPNSDRYIAAINASGSNHFLHPDFGSNPDYGIPYVVVPPDQSDVPIRFTAYGDESDPGPYPIPLNAPIESGSDHHVLALQSGACKLYELFDARRQRNGWAAGSGAVFDLSSDALRPDGWTSADAAGLPIFPGLVRRDEVATGHIDHALRFTVDETQAAYIHPATHFASSSTDPDLPPMGLRLRLKASYDLSRFHGASLVILQALKRYGMLVADNGSNWYITGATDTGWNDDDLNQLKGVPGSAFEVVDTGEQLHH
jgi:hypothetical protein